jgi:hypothetical protein
VAAEHILLNLASTATTELVRNGLISAAEAIETGRQDEDDNLRRLAESVRPDGPLLDQQVTVHEFFQESARSASRDRRLRLLAHGPAVCAAGVERASS